MWLLTSHVIFFLGTTRPRDASTVTPTASVAVTTSSMFTSISVEYSSQWLPR